ncbi:MAG: glycerophosphodiester phosphodiesterase [Ilumatobacteraceae bacterium]
MQQRLPSLFAHPIAFAHRGARAHALENTLEAFRLALRLGATGLESDAWSTADGHVVLDHDGVVKFGVRKRSISEVTRTELPSHIPTLDELFEACGTSYHLSLDIKDPSTLAAVMSVVRNRDTSMLDRLWICHSDYQFLVSRRRDTEGAHLVDSTRLAKIKEGPERRAATLATNGIDACNMHHTDWNGGLVALFHRFGVATFGWDLQYEPALQSALRMGMDAVYSDWVDRMADVYRREIGALEIGDL